MRNCKKLLLLRLKNTFNICWDRKRQSRNQRPRSHLLKKFFRNNFKKVLSKKLTSNDYISTLITSSWIDRDAIRRPGSIPHHALSSHSLKLSLSSLDQTMSCFISIGSELLLKLYDKISKDLFSRTNLNQSNKMITINLIMVISTIRLISTIS